MQVSKVFYVYDAPSGVRDTTLHYIRDTLGYEVDEFQVVDDNYESVQDFVKQFSERIGPKRDYVLYICHFTQVNQKTICMYCSETKSESSALLKSAIGYMYVRFGRTRCVMIHPPHCCDADSRLLPKIQIEGMSIAYDAEKIGTTLEDIGEKFIAVQTIDNHKKETKHVLSVSQSKVVEEELPLSSADVLRLVAERLQATSDADVKSLAGFLGVSKIQWAEHLQKVGSQAMFLVFRKVLAEDKLLAWNRIADAMDRVADFPGRIELLRVITDCMSDKRIMVSEYPVLQHVTRGNTSRTQDGQETSSSGEPEEFLGGKGNAWKNNQAPADLESGMHMEKINTSLLPVHLKQAVEKELSMTPEELANYTADQAEKARKRDEDFERRRLEREVLEYKGQATGTLLGAFASSETGMTKIKK